MAKTMKLFGVLYAGSLGPAYVPVKADSSEEAKTKFLKKYPKLSEDVICGDIDEIEPTNKRYGFFKNHAI